MAMNVELSEISVDSELLGRTLQARRSKSEIEEIEERGGESTQNAGCHTINAPDAGEWGVPEARPGRSHRRDTDAAEDKEQ